MKNFRLFLTMLICFISFISSAQVPFTPGNVVVLRVGDGSVPLTDGSRPVFLDEYTPAGILKQSIAMPKVLNGANHRLTLNGFSGSSDQESGTLILSPNGQWLTAVGYDTVDLIASSLIDDASVKRTIAVVDYSATVNTSTALTDVGAGLPYSAITTNGIDLWSIFYQVGIQYTVKGSFTSTNILGVQNLNRIVGISNNQLYASIRNGFIRSIGSGLPTTGPQTATILSGIPSLTGQCQFFFADLNNSIAGDDVLYVAHGNSGLTKYSFDGTSWVSNGTIGTGEDNYFGITGKVNGSLVTLYCTRKINTPASDLSIPASPNGGGELITLTDASGYNGTLTGTPTVLATAAFQTGIRGVAFAPQPSSVKVSAKAFLQGAYNTILSRHKDVTTAWANVLNANALTQPFNIAPFNYAGTEQVSAGFFTSNSGATTDVTDWVLVELRDGSNPATLISRKAAFIREDGQIVATDGGPVSLTTPAGDGNYYITVRHRNHLAIRSANPIALNGNTTTVYDFTTAQSQAFQNPSVPGNAAMATKDLPGTETGKFLLWGGNANGDGFIRASGASNVSDYLTLLGPLCLQGDFSKIINSVYRKEDMNLDGVVRASAALNVNDYITLLSTGILGGNTSNIITAH